MKKLKSTAAQGQSSFRFGVEMQRSGAPGATRRLIAYLRLEVDWNQRWKWSRYGRGRLSNLQADWRGRPVAQERGHGLLVSLEDVRNQPAFGRSQAE